MTKHANIQSLLWLALALALAGSLKHLAAIFASVDGNHFMGWLQAVAIDAGLFALAYSLRQRKADKRPVRPLWFGVSLFTLISIYGNLAYGIMATTGSLPAWIAVTKPVVLAATLPILVLYLAELVSDNQQYAALEAAKAARKQGQRPESSGADVGDLDTARAATQDKMTERRQTVGRLATRGLTEADIAERVGVSVRTIQRDIAALSRNGNGAK